MSATSELRVGEAHKAAEQAAREFASLLIEKCNGDPTEIRRFLSLLDTARKSLNFHFAYALDQLLRKEANGPWADDEFEDDGAED
jgi:hypothetical protein